MSGTNPLASTRATAPGPKADDPMLRHAQIWSHVHRLGSDAIAAHVDAMDHILPTLGALAADPNVNAKDVIKAATNAVAAGKMSPSRAVAEIADMPADPDKLRPWLHERYADALATTVHAKAALMARQQAAQGAPGGAPAPAQPAMAPASPQPVQAPPGAVQ